MQNAQFDSQWITKKHITRFHLPWTSYLLFSFWRQDAINVDVCDTFVVFMPNWNLLYIFKSIYDFEAEHKRERWKKNEKVSKTKCMWHVRIYVCQSQWGWNIIKYRWTKRGGSEKGCSHHVIIATNEFR